MAILELICYVIIGLLANLVLSIIALALVSKWFECRDNSKK